MEMYLLKSGTLHYGFMGGIGTVVNVQILYKSFIHCFLNLNFIDPIPLFSLNINYVHV